MLRERQRPTDAAEGVQGAAIVVLAVKPQVMGSVLPVLKSNASAETLFVSIAAGVSCATIEAALATGARVVRTMPNTPALVGCGATALCAGSHATAADLETAEALFSSVGIAVTVPEKSIDAVTGVSGSGPAYVFLFLEALADGGVQQGLPRDVALKLAGQTVLGAAKLMMESGTHPGVLKDQVTSPGGTTIAAVRALEDGAFRGTTMSAVAAACARSKELSKA